MADTTYSGVWTKAGLEKLAEFASSGDGITITHIALGDGNGSTPIPSESVTALAHECWRGSVTSVSKNEDESSVAVEIVVPYDVGGFFIREWGIFDTDGDLIAYGNHADFYKALLAEGTGAELREIIELPVSSDGQITIQVNYESLATVAYVGQEVEGLEEKIDAVQEEIEEKVDTLESKFETDLEEHNTDPEAHGNLATPDATTDIKGKIALATSAQVLTGEEAGKAVTPATLQAKGTDTIRSLDEINADENPTDDDVASKTYFASEKAVASAVNSIEEDIVAIEANITNLEEGKADTDLSNTNPSQDFIDTSTGWMVPDYDNAVTITNSVSTTMLADGCLYVGGGGYNGAKSVYVNGTSVAYVQRNINGYNWSENLFISVAKGDVVLGTLSGSMTLSLKFYPFKGAITDDETN